MLPPKRQRPGAKPLFATEAVPAPKERKAPDRVSLDIAPYVSLHIYADGTASADAPIGIANWEHIAELSRERARKMLDDLAFIERWQNAAKSARREIELRV
jgi:hypothetical protein